MSAEAHMRPENALCVGLILNTNTRSRQCQYLPSVSTTRHEVDVQTEVAQEHLRFKIQPVDRYLWRDMALVYRSDVFGNTFQRHLGMQTMPAQRTRHVVRQKVQRQSTRVESVLTLQLDAIVTALGSVPDARSSVYFDLCACAVKYTALDTAVRRVEHHVKSVVINTL